MRYLEQLDAWIIAILLGGEEGEDEEQWFVRVRKQLKEIVVQSYRNGQKAGFRPKPADDQQEPPGQPSQRQ